MHVARESASGWIDDRRGIHSERLERFAHRAKLGGVKTGAHSTGVMQCSIVFVHADDQGPKALSRTGSRGVTGDDELLLLAAFELDPVSRSLANIRAVSAFADHALESPLAGLRSDLLASTGKHLAQAQHRMTLWPAQHTAQFGLPLDERALS